MSAFTINLEEKLNKVKICDILRKEIDTDIDDGRIKTFRIVLVCTYKNQKRKCKVTHTSDIRLLDPEVEKIFDSCKEELSTVQKNHIIAKQVREFQEISEVTLEILTMYNL